MRLSKFCTAVKCPPHATPSVFYDINVYWARKTLRKLCQIFQMKLTTPQVGKLRGWWNYAMSKHKKAGWEITNKIFIYDIFKYEC